MAGSVAKKEQSFHEEGLFEYHLYSLERPTSLLDKETKQVALLSAEGVDVVKKLVLNGQEYFYRWETATANYDKVITAGQEGSALYNFFRGDKLILIANGDVVHVRADRFVLARAHVLHIGVAPLKLSPA